MFPRNVPQKILNISRHDDSVKSPPGMLIWGLPQKFPKFRVDNFFRNLSNHRSDMHNCQKRHTFSPKGVQSSNFHVPIYLGLG